MNLSAIIITKNEAQTISRCLRSLAFTDEQIVVDAGSSDETTRIAQESGAKVFVKDWQGFGKQKNYGASLASGKWLLFIDADEEVSPELAQAIMSTVSTGKHDFYWLRIVTLFLHRPLHHLYGHNLRLFRKGAGEWTDNFVHEQVRALTGGIVHLGDVQSQVISKPLLHHSYSSIASYLIKMRHYTTLDAQQMLKTKQHRSGKPVSPTILLPFYLSLKQLFKLLVYRRGILDGIPGIVWSTLSAYYEWEMAWKFLKGTRLELENS